MGRSLDDSMLLCRRRDAARSRPGRPSWWTGSRGSRRSVNSPSAAKRRWVAATLKIKQPSVHKIEKQTDLYLSHSITLGAT